MKEKWTRQVIQSVRSTDYKFGKPIQCKNRLRHIQSLHAAVLFHLILVLSLRRRSDKHCTKERPFSPGKNQKSIHKERWPYYFGHCIDKWLVSHNSTTPAMTEVAVESSVM